jgi:two-component system CheB/CheR fusion protein
VIPILHYAISPGSFLWLGASETIGPYRELFEIKDSKHKIYVKRAGSGIAEVGFRLQRKSAVEGDFALSELPLRENERARLNREGERILLARYSPPSVLVSSDLEVLQFLGDTSPYLAPAPGKATLNFLRMLREGLLPGLRAAITKARSERVTVRQEGLQVKTNGGFRRVTVEVVPINSILANQGGFLILFEEAVTDSATGLPAQEVSGGPEPQEPAGSPTGEQQIDRLTQELTATQDYLQSVIEQQEAANEELQSANEEVQSANEELQSVNEELETSKEELESSNEELATINDELNKRNEELSQLNSDLNNVFDSVQMAVILVGRDLRIRRFTTDAGEMFNINAADVGRPVGHFKLGVIVPDLESLLMETIDRGTALEREVQDKLGHWFSVRIRPYKTLENKIDGAVLTLVDIDTVKRARQLAENIVATLREPLLVLDGNLRVQAASRSFCERFQVTPEETEKRLLYELGNGEWDIPDLRRRLGQILERDESFSDYTITHHFERLGHRTMLLNARRLLQDKSQKPLILLAIEDVTTHQDLHGLPATPAEQFGRTEELARAGRSKDEFLAMLAHELRNPLAALANAVEVLTIPRKSIQGRPKMQETSRSGKSDI